jgi:hypothetical protein
MRYEEVGPQREMGAVLLRRAHGNQSDLLLAKDLPSTLPRIVLEHDSTFALLAEAMARDSFSAV